MRAKRPVKPTPIPAKEHPKKEVAKTGTLQVANRFDELVNTWITVHESQEPIKPDVYRKNDDPT